MVTWWTLSESLDTLFWWKNGLHTWSSLQIKYPEPLEEWSHLDTSHTLDLFALPSPLAITSCNSWQAPFSQQTSCGAFKIWCWKEFSQRYTSDSHSDILQINSYNTQLLAVGRGEVTDITETGVCVMQSIQHNVSVSYNAELRHGCLMFGAIGWNALLLSVSDYVTKISA